MLAATCIEGAGVYDATEVALKSRNNKDDYSMKLYLELVLNPVSPSLVDFGLDIITDTLFAHVIEFSWLQRFLEEVVVSALWLIADVVSSFFSVALVSGSFFTSVSA